MINIRILLKSLNYSILDQIIVSGSSFITTIFLARLLDIDNFGIYATFWLLLLFINSLYMALIVFPMMTLVSKKNKKIFYFGSLLVLKILFSICILIFASTSLYLYSLAISKSCYFGTYTISLFALLIALHHFQDFFRRYFFIKKHFKNVLILDVVSHVLRFSILGVLLLENIEISLNIAFIIFIICYLMGIFYALRYYRYKLALPNIKIDLYDHWQLSKWLLPSGLMQWSSINFFLVIAPIILSPTVVGVIRLGQNIINVFNILLQSIENVIPIEASKIYIRFGTKPLIRFILKISLIGMCGILFLGIVIVIFSKDLISLLYGIEYEQYYYVLIWYIVIFLFTFILVIFRIFLRTIKNTRIWFFSYIFASVYSLLISYPLIKFLNIYGVLLGILSAHIVLLISSYFFMKKEGIVYGNTTGTT